ncbi:unnamed protein product [Mytilus coruscus]|uniref:Tyr recombinase domain-containing protein n=1 Tax=Mytilus coruscus TaxID=42192 RepID=A0A6J8BSN3_MYTCO|nr:unnamed protein product [Mytilus coruscus]
MLVAGELEIINNFCKNKSEKQGRLKLLQKIAYFSSIYHWASVLEFYAAWLRFIELGRKTWSDDSQMLENVLIENLRNLETIKLLKNHSGARDFAKDIDKYIKKEVGYGAVLGPFASNPFNDHLVISPLNSVPKANSEERRVIMDLSFPKGKSVNDGIYKNVYLGKHVELHYPNVDNFIEIIKEKVIVCLKLWGQKGRKICIQCDNMVSVQVINQGKSRSRFLQACLREICFICAIKECELRAIHIDGIDNRLPDMLSRWSLSDIYPIQFYKSIEVQFHWSKTIQFGERVLEIPIIKNLSSPLCAFSAFKAMCIKFPASASSPAFLVLSGRKIKPVSYNMLQTFLKNIIEKIGLDPTRYSSHSFRRGGATWAFQCGVSSELIQLQGDWKSDAFKLYLRYGLADKLQVSSKMICRL